MLIDWSARRRKETFAIPERELEKSPEMQYRRELTFIYQESAFQLHVPLYGVISIERVEDSQVRQTLQEILPGARAAIVVGSIVGDPMMNLLYREAGITMKNFVAVSTTAVEIFLMEFEDKLQVQGFKAASVRLPQTPHREYARVIAASGMGFVGRNSRLITRNNGCRIQLGMVVTDAPLLHGDYRYEPYTESRCGDCRICEEYCPAGALKEGQYDKAACTAFRNNPDNQLHLTDNIRLLCDACMRVCPLGDEERWDSRPVTWEEILSSGSLNH